MELVGLNKWCASACSYVRRSNFSPRGVQPCNVVVGTDFCPTT